MSSHTVLLFLEAYELLHVLEQTHILTQKLTHLSIILLPSCFITFLFSSPLRSTSPSFQARELTRVQSLMNNIDKAGLLKQKHSGSSHTWIY